MGEQTLPPFSVRNRGAHGQIDSDCPETARVGLLHVLRGLVNQECVGWDVIIAELERIGRVRPTDSMGTKSEQVDLLLSALEWEKVFNFCERLYFRLVHSIAYYDHDRDSTEVVKTKTDVQEGLANELNQLFLEENLAFEFTNGLVRRRGRRHTADLISRSNLVLGDAKFSSARAHFNKALKFFREVAQLDYENAVKEAVCAVEAVGRALFPSGGPTLADVVKSITGSGDGKLSKSIANTFHGLYGFRSGGEGVGHGGAFGGRVTKELAEYSLGLAASQVVLLVDMAAASEPEVPF